jgi:hypothetical protein
LYHFLETNRLLKDKQLLDPKKRLIEYVYVGPDSRLTRNALEFNPKKIREMIEEGYNKAKELKTKK